MNRVAEVAAGTRPEKLLVPFFTVGYPDLKTTIALARSAADAGADIIELGMPFSDPLADGPQIQHSSQAALDNGIGLRSVLDSVRKLRRHVSVPLVLMGYYNPLLAYGEDRFLKAAATAGVDGFIIPDLPVEEGAGFKTKVESGGMSSLFLVAPTSSPQRIRMIDKNSTDLVYAVTVTGVTGVGRSFSADTDRYLRSLKKSLSKRFVAGFGVSSAESARRLTRYADGGVIGSALVKIIREASNRKGCVRQVSRFLGDIRRAL
ncbi:MAG: tryptophan synthase subunit alpha [candidate division Zixibacteria bacterium]|nr:tryptophan synthase subunit alpha [candidate division Zixibacteria bacterium]